MIDSCGESWLCDPVARAAGPGYGSAGLPRFAFLGFGLPAFCQDFVHPFPGTAPCAATWGEVMAGKKPAVVWTAEIKSGRIIIQHRADFDAYHAAMKDGPLEVITRRPRKSGTGPTEKQRNYYWPVIVAMFAVLWDCEPEDAHQTLLTEFALERREPGKAVNFKTLSEMDDPAFVEYYYEWCRARALRDRVRIPLPREVFDE